MENKKTYTIDVSGIDESKLPKKDRGENIRKYWYKFSLNKLSVVGLVIVIAVCLVALFYKQLAPYPEHVGAVINFADASKAPCAQYPLGTDVVGRDMLSRIMCAFRGALYMGCVAIIILVPFGGAMGLIAGYFAGKPISNIIMRVADVFLSVPSLVLVMCVSSVLTPSLRNAMLAICVSWWPWYTRLVYGCVTSTRTETYIKSAEVLGASNGHILFKEILPNALGSLLTKMTLNVGVAILAGATLSFVGMGEQPPTPSLGAMVSDGVEYLPNQWWLSIFPAVAIMIIVLGFNLLGDGIKDMLSDSE